MDNKDPEKHGSRRWLWAQRISLLIIPAVTFLLCFAFIIIELFSGGMLDSWQKFELFWLSLLYYAMPLPVMVLVVAWLRPYAGSIVAFISILLVIFYYAMLTYFMDWPDAPYPETILKIAILGIPEVSLLALGGVFGLLWNKSTRVD